MRWLLCSIAWSSVAYADHSTLYGVGSAVARNEPGVMTRIEKRIDILDTDDDDESAVFGARIGIEHWRASTWGVAMPLGFYAGAQVENVRTSIGGGVGLWAFTGQSRESAGVAPFASTTIEVMRGKLVVAIDARLARQTLFQVTDYNVYSLMFMFGPRFR